MHPGIGVHQHHQEANIEFFGENYEVRLSDPAFTVPHWQGLADSFESYCSNTAHIDHEIQRLVCAYAFTVGKNLALVPTAPTQAFAVTASLAAARCLCCYHGNLHAAFDDLLPYLKPQYEIFSELASRPRGILVEL